MVDSGCSCLVLGSLHSLPDWSWRSLTCARSPQITLREAVSHCNTWESLSSPNLSQRDITLFPLHWNMFIQRYELDAMPFCFSNSVYSFVVFFFLHSVCVWYSFLWFFFFFSQWMLLVWTRLNFLFVFFRFPFALFHTVYEQLLKVSKGAICCISFPV